MCRQVATAQRKAPGVRLIVQHQLVHDLAGVLMKIFLRVCIALLVARYTGVVISGDWPMRGRDSSRNAVSLETDAPADWQIATDRDSLRKSPNTVQKNVLWTARLGSYSLADPVIANGLVWLGTNNDSPRDPAVKQDASVLMCFRERDGKFLYQYVSPRLEEGKRFDWEYAGLASSPLVEGDRLWFCNNRCEIICLDIGPLHTGKGEPRLLWKIDMRKELGVMPRAVMIGNNGIHCSVASYHDLIYVNTTNARGYEKVPAPEAPSLVCLQKNTGRVVWSDNSPGARILDVQHGSPLVVEVEGQAQVIMGQGDGWLRSFNARTGKLLWEFDINFKTPGSRLIYEENRNYFIATPVFYSNRIYIASGRHADFGERSGRLVCLTPTKLGDVSSELEDDSGRGKPNPNSALVWEYSGQGEEVMGRAISSVAIHKNILIAPDFAGLIHCLAADSGQMHWVHDTKTHIYGAPLIVDGKIYLGNEDGDVYIFELAKKKRLIVKHCVNGPLYASPVFANGVLYITSGNHLDAIKTEKW